MQNEQDLEAEFKQHKKAAEQGVFNAKFQLANFYLNGYGVKKDPVQAVNLFKQIANQVISVSTMNDIMYISENTIQAEAQYQLGNCYYEGIGVKQDYAQAFDWFQKATERNEQAKLMLAECYFKGNGVKKDCVHGFKWLEEVAKSPQAQLKLAIRYYFCKEIEQNHIRAIEWFKKAANPQAGCWQAVTQAVTQAHTMLGISYYGVKNNDSALKSFKESSEKDDSVGHLWLAYIYELKNKQKFEGLNIECDQKSWWHPTDSEYIPNLHAEYRQQDIDKLLCRAAAGFFLKDDGYNYTATDIIDFIFPKDYVIEFLESQNFSYAKVILAFYHQCKNEKEKSLALLNEAASQNDILAYYLLGMHYKGTDFDKAKEYFDKVEKEGKKQSTYEKDTATILTISSQKEIISHQNEKLEEKNKHIEEAHKKLIELVRSTSHTVGNLLRPSTEERIAGKLQNSPFSKESKELFYASSDIKYVQWQFKLLGIMSALIGSETIRSQIKLDQTNQSNDSSISIEGILNLAAFRAIDKLFDNNERSLKFARETMQKNQYNFSELFVEYQKYALSSDSGSILSIISWSSEKLRPIKLVYECDDWKKIFFADNSQSVALFFCYFFELFFNAFKYADHNSSDFLTITLGSEVINGNDFLTMKWENPKSNKPSVGTNKGLELSASYISLLNPDECKEESQEVMSRDDNFFQLITRINKETFNL